MSEQLTEQEVKDGVHMLEGGFKVRPTNLRERYKEQESSMFKSLAQICADADKEQIAALRKERDEWAEDLLVAKAGQFKLNVDIKNAESVLSDAYLRRLKTEVAITRLAYLIVDVDSEIEELEKK